MDAKLLFTYALTPLHAGTGRGVGVIDLPIAREVATGIPYLPGSSLKGVLRDKSGDNDTTNYVFGPSTKNIEESNLAAGAAQFTDQRLLLLPVRSLKGTFAWVTCPFVLHRLRRECEAIGETQNLPKALKQPAKKEDAFVPEGQKTLTTSGKIVLEDLDLSPVDDQEVLAWATWLGEKLFTDNEWREMLTAKLVVVHDDVFSYLLQTGTEVVARIQIDDSKTVVKGGLWYEENLPAESVLWGLVAAQQVGKGEAPTKVLEQVRKLTEGVVQLGGNATVGRGLCRLVMV